MEGQRHYVLVGQEDMGKKYLSCFGFGNNKPEFTTSVVSR